MSNDRTQSTEIKALITEYTQLQHRIEEIQEELRKAGTSLEFETCNHVDDSTCMQVHG